MHTSHRYKTITYTRSYYQPNINRVQSFLHSFIVKMKLKTGGIKQRTHSSSLLILVFFIFIFFPLLSFLPLYYNLLFLLYFFYIYYLITTLTGYVFTTSRYLQLFFPPLFVYTPFQRLLRGNVSRKHNNLLKAQLVELPHFTLVEKITQEEGKSYRNRVGKIKKEKE